MALFKVCTLLLLLNFSYCGELSASRNEDGSQEWLQRSSTIHRFIQALKKLDKDVISKEGLNFLSTYKGKVTCTVNGKLFSSEMRIVFGFCQRTMKISNTKNMTCKHLDLSLDENSAKISTSSVSSFSTTTGIKIGRLNAITASSRFSRILYGVGCVLRSSLPVLRFDLAAAFRSTQEILHLKTRLNMIVKSCGLTTGPCPRGGKRCMFYCNCKSPSRKPCGAILFPEPDYNMNSEKITTEKIGIQNILTKGDIKSTTVDKDRKMYMIVTNRWSLSTMLIISIFVRVSKTETSLKMMQLVHLKYDALLSMQITKNGVMGFRHVNVVRIFEGQEVLKSSGFIDLKTGIKRSFNLTAYSIVCWLYSENGLANISIIPPFKGTILRL